MQRTLEWILEAGLLKRTPRSGWSLPGVANAESVADHSFRCAVIGYVLARMEGVDPYRTLLMTLLGDMHEARTTDLHKMAQRYLDTDAGENRAFSEQVEGLPAAIHEELTAVRAEYRAQESPESIVARDADILEVLIQAREYAGQGFTSATDFTKNAVQLATDSARELWARAERTDVNAWWSSIGKFER